MRDCPSDRLNWHDLHVIVRHSRPNSHLFAALFPERAEWDTQATLLGKAVDYLALLVWSKTKAARHGWGKPKSVLPFGKTRVGRKGSKPKAAPLSVIRERMRRLHAPKGPKHLEAPKAHDQRVKDILTKED